MVSLKKGFFSMKSVIAVVMAMLMTGSCVFAADTKSEPKKLQLTYDMAVEMAIKNNSDLKKLADSVETMETSKDNLVKAFIFMPGDTTGNIVTDDITGGLVSSINSLDTGLSTSGYRKELTTKACEFGVKSTLSAIVQAESGLELLQKAHEISTQEFMNTQLKFGMGLISQKDMTDARIALDQKKAQIDKTKLEIENAYRGLATTLGMKSGTEYEIVYDVKFEPIVLYSDIDTYVQRKKATDLGLKISKLTVDDAEFSMKLFTSGNAGSYKEREDNFKAQERAYGDQDKAKDGLIRDAYNGLLTLESDRKVLESALESAQTAYNTAKTNYELGNITKLTLDQAALGVSKAQNDLKANAFSYDLKKYTFENTYLLQ